MSRRHLYFTGFYFGFSSAIIQVVLIREFLSILRGNELIIGIIFAAWFFGIFLGARMSPEGATAEMERRVQVAMVLLPSVSLPLIYGLHAVPLLFPATPGTFYSMGTELLLATVFSLPASFMVGYFFPPVVSLLSRERTGSAGGSVYMIESLGAFFGGVLFSFLFIDLVNPLALCTLLIAASVLSVSFIRGRVLPAAAIPFLVVIVFFSGPLERAFFGKIWEKTHTGQFIDHRRTRYQTVVLERTEGQYNLYGDGIYYYSIPDLYGARPLFHLIRCLGAPENGSVLLSGGGPGSLAVSLARSGIGELHYCEIDRDLVAMTSSIREPDDGGSTGKKIIIIPEDFRHYLRHGATRYDMIILLSPPPENAMLNRFYTSECYRLVRGRLKNNGIFITRIHGFASYMNPEHRRYLATCYRNFSAEFPSVMHTTGEEMFLIGSPGKGMFREGHGKMIERYASSMMRRPGKGVHDEIIRDFHPAELLMWFEKSRLDQFTREIVPLAGEMRLNTDLSPRLYRSHLIYTAQQEGSALYRMLDNPLLYFIPFLAATVYLFRRIRRRYGTPLYRGSLIALTAGFAGMAAAIIMIQFYQAFYGVVYYRISLINAVFMLGLTAGAFIAYMKKIVYSRLVMAAVVASLLLLLPYAFLRREYLFWTILLLFSASCGAVIPSLFRVYKDEPYHRTASLLDATEHYGSITGSLFISLGLIPLAGIPATILLLTVIALAVMHYEYITGRR